jgi:anti-anti-sigma factor
MAELYEERVRGVTVLRISGSLNPAGLTAVEAAFEALAGRNDVHVVADLGEVDTITTPAFTLMLRTARAVNERGGVMVFANATPNVRRIFECCRLDLVLNLVSDVDAAVNILRSGDLDTPHPPLLPEPHARTDSRFL